MAIVLITTGGRTPVTSSDTVLVDGAVKHKPPAREDLFDKLIVIPPGGGRPVSMSQLREKGG